MITFQSVENALKQVYLGVLTDQINNNDALLSKIKKSTNDVWGKYIIKQVNINGKYYDFKEKIKNMYATIQISDKSIRASQNNAGAFANLLNDEMQTLIIQCSKQIKDAFYDEDKKPDWYPEDAEYNLITLSGIKKLFDVDGEELYGIDRQKNKDINPIIATIDEFKPIKIQEIIDDNNQDVNVLVCNPKLKREYHQYLIDNKQNVSIIEHNNGYKSIAFNNTIPIIPVNIPDNTIYLLNTNDFILNQLCDWQWLENENNNILIQVGCYPIYKATLVKYADYICSKPNKQIKIIIK